MSNLLNSSKIYMLLEKRKSSFLSMIDKIYNYAEDFLPKINRVFANYTGHDKVHSLNVADYMYHLCDAPEELSDLELTVMMYVALLHDIGMVVSEDEIRQVRAGVTGITERKYDVVLNKYKDDIIALQECFRPIHGKRSYEHIMKMSSENFLIPGHTHISFQEDVAKISAAHNENFEWIKNNISSESIKGEWKANFQFIAILLRIADYLDIDDERASVDLYYYLAPSGFGDLEWRQHFDIDNIQKVSKDEVTGKKYIEFYGESSDPSVHRKLLKYFDSISNELAYAVELSETFREKRYMLTIGTTVRNKIRTKGFAFSDFKLSLDYKAVTSLLMGENIYGNKKYGLRELIQNSIDTCMVMKEDSLRLEEYRYESYNPFINISIDHDKHLVVIQDNGRGMSIDILKKYFLNVGVSYYTSDDYLFQGHTYSPIGNYGIGFLACFMLSDQVKVLTKYYKDDYTNNIEFEKNSEYICLINESSRGRHGTEIILEYDSFLEVFQNKTAIQCFIESNFIDCGIPLSLIEIKDGTPSKNLIKLKKINEYFTNSIVLDDYFCGIEVSIDMSYKGIRFVERLSDLGGERNYLFNEKAELEEETNKFDIELRPYVVDGKIRYYMIPIILPEDEEDFIKAYDVLEDFDEAIKKISYKQANIISKELSEDMDGIILESGEDLIFPELDFDQFKEKLEFADEAPSCIYVKEKEVIVGAGRRILPYYKDVKFSGPNFWENTDQLFVKNVLIKNSRICVPFLADGIELKGIVVNVKNKNVVPDISRNSINEDNLAAISYAIGKALHLWILKNGNLDYEESFLVNKLIEQCYSGDNVFLK